MDELSFLASEEVKKFIETHLDSDPQRLLLNPPTNWKEQTPLLADQLISRQKAKNKLPDWYHSQSLIFPPPLSVEQSSSPEAATYKADLLSGSHLVDLTGGMGVDCLALSTRFNNTTYVEQDSWLCRLFAYNQKHLGIGAIEVVHQPAEQFLQTFEGKACFFIDPARRDSSQKKVFRFEDCIPSMAELLPAFRTHASKVLIKAAPLIDLTQGIRELENVLAIHVVSIRNECKEVLFLLDFGQQAPQIPTIHCVNLANKQSMPFTFTLEEEKQTKIEYADAGNYLYDPNASILKAGAFKSITKRYPVKKLSANTHLYTSDQLIKDFPGRSFKVIDTSLGKSALKALDQLNVITKNHPLKPEEVRKKYGIKDGGEQFLVGFRDQNNAPRFCLANSIL